VRTLCEPPFLAVEDSGWEGVLNHASYHQTKGLGVDESVMWGDYFFVEALDKCLGGAWTSYQRPDAEVPWSVRLGEVSRG